ncbi:MAG: GNAT family N-acetyltransferase [Acidobacteria bacterium]|nr:GNAT family N-acetyltransferase [Acidobacteriota bacterium]
MTSTEHDLIVRPYASQDYVRLLALLREVWSHKRDIENDVQNRWWWQWDEPPLYVVEDPAQGTLAGLCAYIPFALRTNGVELPSAWFVDFYVRPDYQGKGLGKRLTQAVQNRHAVTASLSQTAMAYRVFHKLGWSDRSPVTLYVHPLPRRWMFRSASRQHRIVTAAIDGSLSVWLDVDALWMRVRNEFPGIAVRTSATLLARYTTQGNRQYVLVCVYRGQALVGYMIVRVVDALSNNARSPQGLIVDYLVHPGDAAAFGALLSEAASTLVARGVNRIYAISTLPACQRVLRARGFLSPSTPLLGRWVKGNTKWFTYTAKAVSSLPVPAEWHLTLGDCDLDYAWFRG